MPLVRLLSLLLDRGAVLFVGIVTGAVLLFSFQTDGRPLAPWLSNHTPAPVAAPAAHGAQGPGCGDNFPFSPNVLAALRANRPIRIGVFGDSFGEGVWAATNQYFHGQSGFAVYRLGREGTGFTRYRSLDLLKDLKAKLDDQPIDIALIDFGANDTQGIWEDNQGHAYMSPGWQASIGSKIADYVGTLRSRGVAVGWVGLPRMRKADFDADIQAMNAFNAGQMCRLHVPFVDPVAVTEDARHGFTRELVDPATKQAYLGRAEDGIHMTFHGYEVISRPLLQRIAQLAPPQAQGAGE